jgi:trigger factor
VKIAVEELEACKRRLRVEAAPDLVQKAWEEAYGRVQREARLPGFRKGHVPRNLVKLHFADEVRREVAQRLIPEVYREALAESQLHPVEEPDLQEVTLEEGAPLTFTAVVEIKPAIALGTYTGLAVQHTPRPATDRDQEQALAHLQEQHAEFRQVERPAGEGDLAIVDYTLAPEGLPPRSEQGYAFLVGSGGVLPEIDEAVLGTSPGEEHEVRVRFPDDYRREDLRAKSGVARVRLMEVKEKVSPALDDDFARTLGCESLENLRETVRKELETRREREDRLALEEKLVDLLLAQHEFVLPEALVLRQIAHMIEHARDRMRQRGVDPDQVQWDYEKLAGELRPAALRAVRRALLLEAIAAREGITPSEEEVNGRVEQIAKARQQPVPAVRRLLERSGDLDALRVSLREARVLDFLIQQATVQPEVH